MKDKTIEIANQEYPVYEQVKANALADALLEIKLLRQLIFNVFDQNGIFTGMNRHDQAKIAEIVTEFSK